jgi:hypothetical protein
MVIGHSVIGTGRIELIPNSGHYPMIETPVYLTTVLKTFLPSFRKLKNRSDLEDALTQPAAVPLAAVQ